MTVEGLVDAACAAVRTVLPGMGFEPPTIVGKDPVDLDGLSGAFVALTGEDAALQMGLFADEGANEWMARTMLYMEEDEEIDPEDISDALCEMANQIAGGVKRELSKQQLAVMIGLPVFVEGKFNVPNGQQAGVKVKLGDYGVSMFLCHGN